MPEKSTSAKNEAGLGRTLGESDQAVEGNSDATELRKSISRNAIEGFRAQAQKEMRGARSWLPDRIGHSALTRFYSAENRSAVDELTRITILDPLDGDKLFSHVPEMNACADLGAITNALRVLLPSHRKVAAYSFEECLAAMRDIGLLLGSIKRHGMQPVTLVPELEPVLIELGRRTDMIPRDTIHHYTEWNPRGPRQRMYTGDPQESALIDAVRMSLPPLGQAVELCKGFFDLEPTEPLFVTALEVLAEKIGFFVQAITDVVEKVQPEFFARVMRPYFEEVTVSDINYYGPAAAHVPLCLVDLVVWASDHGDAIYDAFLRGALQYTLPQWRRLAREWGQKPSLVTKVSEALGAVRPHDVPGNRQRSAEALFRVLRTLTVFRGKHFGIAKNSYREGIGLYEVGSGGGSIGLLRKILNLTRQNESLICRPHHLQKAR